ncbi:MAG: flagellar hook assembly protein FlgD [Gammaproteobacteria bacterium]|nr:flagellar hook assembly protein FlgD [Gammaproteobacteria bacterium]
MTGISGTDSLLASLQTPPAAVRKDSKSLGQEDFLALMITQLQSQDPLKPMENGEFIGQMAQFSTVTGIAEMTKSVSTLTSAYNSGQALQAASMVGRTILTEDNSAVLAPGKPLAGAVELPWATQAAKVRIYSDTGQLVRELPLGAQGAGISNFSWDGTLANGQTAPAGRYSMSAAIESRSGDTALVTYVASKVSSVTLSGNGSGTQLRTDGGASVSLSQVKAVM